MANEGRIVVVAYRPKRGKAEALKKLIAGHVATLRAQKLVTDREPITMVAKDGTIVEVFEWVSAAAIQAAHSNPAVQAMWEEYAPICDYIPIAQVPEAAQLFSEFTPVEVPPRKRSLFSRPTPSPGPLLPRRRRNEHGNPPGTLYAGGTPRFDETGGLAPPPGKRRK